MTDYGIDHKNTNHSLYFVPGVATFCIQYYLMGIKERLAEGWECMALYIVYIVTIVSLQGYTWLFYYMKETFSLEKELTICWL